MASDDVQASRAPVWSPWGDRLLAVLAVGLALCFVWWWIGTAYLDLPLSTYLSWKPDDLPVAVPPHIPEAILGSHYFGDFQESRWGGVDILDGSSPYRFANIYPPGAAWFMVPFALLPVIPSFLAYIALTTAALLLPMWFLLRGVRPSLRLITIGLAGAATAPFIATVDRGNLQGLTIALVGFTLVALQRSRTRWACVLLALAICLKPFFIVLALAAILRGRRTFATNTIALALAATVIAWLAIPGDRLTNLANIIRSQVDATSGPDFVFAERVWANSSLHGLLANVARIAEDVFGATFDASSTVLGAAVVAGWLALVGVVVGRRRLPQWVWGTLALSCLQLAQPYAATYTATWASLAAVWFAVGTLIPPRLAAEDDERVDHWVTALRALAIAALAITLLPLALRPGTTEVVVPIQQMAGPILWIALGVTALLASLARGRSSTAHPASSPPELSVTGVTGATASGAERA